MESRAKEGLCHTRWRAAQYAWRKAISSLILPSPMLRGEEKDKKRIYKKHREDELQSRQDRKQTKTPRYELHGVIGYGRGQSFVSLHGGESLRNKHLHTTHTRQRPNLQGKVEKDSE